MRSLLLVAACVALLSACLVSCDVPGDRIASLPNYGKPMTAQYSGFLPADAAKTVFLHYWFVTSPNATTDPVTVWMNGGPGCSSLEGLLYEQGPFRFTGQVDGNGLPYLTDNPNAWSTISNMLFIEQPAGVGFSYALNGSMTSDDYIQSQNTYGFLLSFFAAYPEFAKNDFFITGESYAGIYVPTLANRVLQGNNAGNPMINLKGFAVGNGCIGNSVGTCGNGGDSDQIEVDFFHGHGMIDSVLYAQIYAACGDFKKESQQCQSLIQQAENNVGNIDVYNVYDVCGDDTLHQAVPLSQMTTPLRAETRYTQRRRAAAAAGLGDPVVCIPSAYAPTYLDDSGVRAALHLANSSVSSWAVCSNINYNNNIVSLLPLYPTLISNYRVLIYSGDADACVPHVGTERWTRSLGYSEAQSWHPYSVGDHVGGFATNYQSPNGFWFVTIKHAGHMVPQFEPEAALVMFQAFISNTPL